MRIRIVVEVCRSEIYLTRNVMRGHSKRSKKVKKFWDFFQANAGINGKIGFVFIWLIIKY